MKFFYILAALMLSLPLQTQAEGGHTGSGGGGGTVHCPGQPVLVLDYYEALKTVNGKTKKLLDLDHMDREMFFKLMRYRIDRALDAPRGGFIHRTITGGASVQTSRLNNAKIKSMMANTPPIDTWESFQPFRLHDEAITESLPKECSFHQAAVTFDDRHYQNPDEVKLLSHGQKLVLELHEILSYRLLNDFGGTSLPIRRFVSILIQKLLNQSDLFLAYQDLVNPNVEHKLTARATSINKFTEGPGSPASIFYQKRGLYALDLRMVTPQQKEAYSHCPKWFGYTQAIQGSAYAYLIDQNGDTSPLIQEVLLPAQELTLERKTISVRYDGPSPNTSRIYERTQNQKNTTPQTLRFELLNEDQLRLTLEQKSACPYLWIESNEANPIKGNLIAQNHSRNGYRFSENLRRVIQETQKVASGLGSDFREDFTLIGEFFSW